MRLLTAGSLVRVQLGEPRSLEDTAFSRFFYFQPILQKPTRTVGNAFRDHIPNSYRWITENKGTAPDSLAVICAWDEIGEGGYIIPTKGGGLAMLEGMRETVGVINGNK